VCIKTIRGNEQLDRSFTFNENIDSHFNTLAD